MNVDDLVDFIERTVDNCLNSRTDCRVLVKKNTISEILHPVKVVNLRYNKETESYDLVLEYGVESVE
jgi:hypothetical protein